MAFQAGVSKDAGGIVEQLPPSWPEEDNKSASCARARPHRLQGGTADGLGQNEGCRRTVRTASGTRNAGICADGVTSPSSSKTLPLAHRRRIACRPSLFLSFFFFFSRGCRQLGALSLDPETSISGPVRNKVQPRTLQLEGLVASWLIRSPICIRLIPAFSIQSCV